MFALSASQFFDKEPHVARFSRRRNLSFQKLHLSTSDRVILIKGHASYATSMTLWGNHPFTVHTLMLASPPALSTLEAFSHATPVTPSL